METFYDFKVSEKKIFYAPICLRHLYNFYIYFIPTGFHLIIDVFSTNILSLQTLLVRARQRLRPYTLQRRRHCAVDAAYG